MKMNEKDNDLFFNVQMSNKDGRVQFDLRMLKICRKSFSVINNSLGSFFGTLFVVVGWSDKMFF